MAKIAEGLPEVSVRIAGVTATTVNVYLSHVLLGGSV